jgi:hypothetical protein
MLQFPLSAPVGHHTVKSLKMIAWATAAMSTSPYTGSQQVYQWPGEGWKLDVALAPMKASDAEPWIAFLTSLRGRAGTFVFGDTARKTPQGVATGTPVSATPAGTLGVFGASATANRALVIHVGDCVVIFVNDIALAAPTVSDNGSGGGNTYVQVGPEQTGTGRGSCWICFSARVSATQVTITTSGGSGDGPSISAGTFQNIAGIGAVHTSAGLGTAIADTIVTTHDNVIVAVGLQVWNNPAPTISVVAGTLEASSPAQAVPPIALEAFLIQGVANAGTAVTTSLTASVSTVWQMWSVELIAASNQAGDTHLTTSGWTPNTPGIMKAGDYIEVPAPAAASAAVQFMVGGGNNTPLTVTTLAGEIGHNTSAYSAYNQQNKPANFSGKAWVNQNGQFIFVDKNFADDSLNPVTPCHVSPISVKTLIPAFTGKWYVLVVPYQWTTGSGHIDIGIDMNTDAYIDAMLADIKARGFDCLFIDWYGPSRYEDTVTLRIKSRIALTTGLTYAIMIDTGPTASPVYTTTAQLSTLLTYLNTNYFGDSKYEKKATKPFLQFWGNGPTGAQAAVDYSAAKAAAAVPIYMSFQGPGPLTLAAADATYDWVQPYLSGVNTSDPYNLAAKTSYLNSVHSNAKGAMPAISPKFNGTLTKSVWWSEGKYLPSHSGKCWLAQAALVNANLPVNTDGIYVSTWNDWQEGTAIEPTIDPFFTVLASLSGNVVSWSINERLFNEGDTVSEVTISSYEVIASADGISAVLVGTQSTGGSNTLDLGNLARPCTVYVVAIGKACYRSIASNGVPVPVNGGGGGGGGGGGNASPGAKRLYKVMVDANSDSNGNVTFDVFPRLREDVPDSTVIVTASPRGTFRLAGNQQEWDIDSAKVYGISFQAVEAI